MTRTLELGSSQRSMTAPSVERCPNCRVRMTLPAPDRSDDSTGSSEAFLLRNWWPIGAVHHRDDFRKCSAGGARMEVVPSASPCP